MSNIKLYIVSFIVGAVVMIFELVGSRIAAPYIGGTMIVWTSIVGVLLAFMSLGYYFGGRTADRFDEKKLSLLLVAPGYWLVIVAFFKEPVLYQIAFSFFGEGVKAILVSIFLFSVFAVALGAITPIIVGISIKKLRESGKITGYLWALSTIGSIVGTFTAGFWLVPVFGSLRLVYFLAFVLSMTAIFLSFRNAVFFKLVLVLVSILGLLTGWHVDKKVPGQVADIETTMYHVRITEVGNLKKMYIDNALSSRYSEGVNSLSFEKYYKYYDLMFWNKRVKEVVMVGGAGMTYPKYALDKYPGLFMDVIEIDPGMEKIAEKYLGYVKSTQIKVINGDGRVYFQNNKKKYDAILVDAFLGDTIPFHLVTKEALLQMKVGLNDDGVVVSNIYGALSGSDSQLFRSILTTYKAVFEDVKVFAVTNRSKIENLQSLIILASNNKLLKDPYLDKTDKPIFLEKEVKKDIQPGHLLTDDWAPIDYWTYKQETY